MLKSAVTTLPFNLNAPMTDSEPCAAHSHDRIAIAHAFHAMEARDDQFLDPWDETIV